MTPRPRRSSPDLGHGNAQETDASVLLGSRALLAVVARSLGAALEDVTLPQFRLLVVLSTRGAMRSGDLAEAVGLHPSTMSRSAERLVKGGWVERLTNPDSRREIMLRLSASGAALVREVTQRRSAEIASIMSRLSTGDRRRVREAFDLFSRAAGEGGASELLLLGLWHEGPDSPSLSGPPRTERRRGDG